MAKQLFARKTVSALAAGLLLLLLALGGCTAADHQANHTSQLRKPFIPPADHLVSTGYQSGYESAGRSGDISLLFDNKENGFHVKAALFKISDSAAELTTIITIRKGEQFIVNNLTAGKYEVQFQNLYTGKYFKLEPFSITAAPTSKRIQLYQPEKTDPIVHPIPRADF